ncbi:MULTISPECIES: hypothetical protein [unclassified Luteibacter]|uniref:hypothetical protein n=1 Tax=Luteibacter sp. PvP019 TaxID=3156436 RepID=UPI00339419A5
MHYPGKAPPSFVETRRLPAGDGAWPDGLTPLDPATLATLRTMRQRRPVPRDRLSVTLAIAAAILLHLLLIVVVSYEMQPRVQIGFYVPHGPPDVLEVRFIDRAPPPAVPSAPPPPPVTEPPPKVRSAEATRPEPPPRKKKPDEVTPAVTPSDAPPAATAPASGVFGADGSIALPKGAPGSGGSDYTPPRPTDAAGVMSHKTTVTYTQTRFEKDWAPRDENVLSQGMRRAIEKTTVKKTVDLGHGVRVNCSTVFFVLPVGCGGEDPSKAAHKDGDTRLNMAPANPLVKDLPGAVPVRSEAECIAAYRKDERVPEGCPTDTPLKAMDQENAERARRTGN